MDGFWYKFIESLLLAFAPVLASLAAAALVALVRKWWAEFKQAQPDAAFWLEQAASMAVQAAEQAGMAGYIQDKKQYALEVAQRYLDAKGIKIDVELISDAIEAAVFAELNKGKAIEGNASAIGYALPYSEPE